MKHVHTYLVTLMLMAFAACTPKSSSDESSDTTAMDNTTMGNEQTSETGMARATVMLSSASGSNVSGKIDFTQTGDQLVRMEVSVSGLTPGSHALHIHQNPDCSAPDATSAGGHWNPTNMPHGKRGEGQYHKGDIGNLEADADGNATWTEEVSGWTIGGPDTTNIVNHSVIIHAGPDDFSSQPAGAAGPRVACGVITSTSAM